MTTSSKTNKLKSILKSKRFKNICKGIQKAYEDEMERWHKHEKNGLER